MKMNRMALLAVAAVALAPFAVRAQDAPKAAAPKSDAPTLCVVRGDVIKDTAKAAGKADIGGKTYYVCCKGCLAKLDGSDTAARTKMAKVTDLKVEKTVLEKRLEQVNKELSDMDPKAVAPAAAVKTSAIVPAVTTVYCAVTDELIGAPKDAAASEMYKGKTYYFCCGGCKPKFDADPAKAAAIADQKTAERAANKVIGK
jgi:YHS domain-containing protein